VDKERRRRATDESCGARFDDEDCGFDLALRRSRDAVRHSVNRWHTSKNTARINASNPCSEYMFLDDTACNLASLNLMKYVNASGQFDVAAFKHAVDVTITAQEILVDNASYPLRKSRRIRITSGHSDWATPTLARC